jgi:hypothetical protein
MRGLNPREKAERASQLAHAGNRFETVRRACRDKTYLELLPMFRIFHYFILPSLSLAESVVLPMSTAPTVPQHIRVFDVSQVTMRVQWALVVCDMSLVCRRAYRCFAVTSLGRNTVTRRSGFLSNF